MYGGVACVVGRLEELAAFAFEELLDHVYFSVLDGVAQSCKGRLDGREARSVVEGVCRVGEAGMRNLGHLTTE